MGEGICISIERRPPTPDGVGGFLVRNIGGEVDKLVIANPDNKIA